jgi:succinate-acetate transporter protein
MNRSRYIVSAIYQGINKRVQNDTPYFNTLMILYFIIFLHVVHAVILLKINDHDILKDQSKNQILLACIFLWAIITFLLWLIFPKAKIINTKIDEKDIKKYYYGAIFYWSQFVS